MGHASPHHQPPLPTHSQDPSLVPPPQETSCPLTCHAEGVHTPFCPAAQALSRPEVVVSSALVPSPLSRCSGNICGQRANFMNIYTTLDARDAPWHQKPLLGGKGDEPSSEGFVVVPLNACGSGSECPQFKSPHPQGQRRAQSRGGQAGDGRHLGLRPRSDRASRCPGKGSEEGGPRCGEAPVGIRESGGPGQPS